MMEEDWFEKAERKLQELEEGTEEWKKWKRCHDGLHTKLMLQLRFTHDDGTKGDKICENCGAPFEGWNYKKDIEEVILKSDDEVVDKFTQNDDKVNEDE